MNNLNKSFTISDTVDLTNCIIKKPSKGIYKPRILSQKQRDYLLHKDDKKVEITETDFSYIKDDYFRESFIELCKDHEKSINYFRKNKYENDKYSVQFKWVYAWPYRIQEKYNFKFYDSYIEYNRFHYAEWGKDRILIADDFRLRNSLGSFMKYSNSVADSLNVGSEIIKRGDTLPGIVTKDLIKLFARLFLIILQGNNVFSVELYLWHVMKFTIDNVIIEEATISSKEIYDICIMEMTNFTQRIPKSPIKYKKKHNHKKYYIEPGYTKENTVNKMKEQKRKQDIAQAFLYCQAKGLEPNIDNIRAAYKAVGGKCSKTKNGFGTLHHVTLTKYIEELKNDPDFKGIVKDGLQRKSQQRSEWYKLIDLSKKPKENYKEIVQEYPDVKLSVYYKARQRQNKE